MGNGEDGQTQSKDEIIQIFSDFMARIAKFDELVSMGSKLLVGFQQALGFMVQPSISKTSALVEHIIKAHNSERVRSYVEAGCINYYDGEQNLTKLHTCSIGLLDYINKAKVVVDELECLVGDVASAVETANRKDEDVNHDLDSRISSNDEEEIPLSDHSKPGVAEYAATMAIIYHMMKQDYTMQVRIVSSLGAHSSPGELETYCQMWFLRPFIDDEIMHEAWSLVPQK
ncbi:hypothetical protein CDL12_20475 [Handroanthus impetiginosus]|uniref:DUF7795 domain-containing protein n=1 Tax=Handroanthus impetiginosus TaxID=429701 RepID=A0A2G9GNT7_9LAMI|nr:hypothetical protein CDL12_20475 [Handroanthus impetiginosus]